jgi:hypothetical protein
MKLQEKHKTRLQTIVEAKKDRQPNFTLQDQIDLIISLYLNWLDTGGGGI